MSSAADPWAAAAQQYKAGGGSAATAPTEPDWKIWTQGGTPAQPGPQPSSSAPAGPSWLPESMRKYIGQVDTSRYEQAQQQGWQPFQQIGQGVKTAVTGPDMQARAGGAHQALTGAMDVGAHLLPAIAPINPLGTAAGIAAGTVAGMGTSAGLKAAGVPEEYANLGGDVAGIAAGGLAGKGASRLTGGGLVGADPETLTWQALQPRGGSGAHYNNAPVVMGDIKASAVRRGLPIRSARELKGAIDSAELDNRDAFSQHWAQVQNRIPLDHVADLIDQTLDPETRRLASLGDPEAQAHVDAVHNYANTFRGQSVTPDEFRALQEHVNAEDDVFQKKSDEKQAKIIAARGGDPTIRAKATAYRDIVRQVAGDDVGDLQTRYGLLRDWNAAAQKAMDKALMEKAGTAMQKGAQVADVPGQIATGQLEKTPPLKGTTDQKIRWAFDRVQPGPALPLPQAMSGNQGAVSDIFQGVNAPRLLPQGTAPFTQGTSAINPSAMRPRYNPAVPQLPAGSPTQGQGVIQVPPAGAANISTPGGSPLIQIPPSPRTAAPPPDTSFVRKGPSPFGSERGSFSNRPTVASEEAAPTGNSLAVRMGKQIWNTLNPTKIGDPNTFSRIQARNVLHHSTNLDAGESILQEGAIVPKRYTDKFLNWGTETQPDIAGQRVGFTGPRTSLSRGQRVGDPITFEVDPSYVKQPKPVQGLPGRKATGKFEFETGTQEPIPAEGIKNVLINTPRANEMYGDAADRIVRIKDLATQRGIPVIEGTESELLSRRPLGMQGPMRPISTVEGVQ